MTVKKEENDKKIYSKTGRMRGRTRVEKEAEGDEKQ